MTDEEDGYVQEYIYSDYKTCLIDGSPSSTGGAPQGVYDFFFVCLWTPFHLQCFTTRKVTENKSAFNRQRSCDHARARVRN